ncbi:hypothetical protein B0H14DRAFT_2638644 [Mycena olivaceomarginata]|nr:hypothetical protein B0H14DRAFT_2638644 [Mycena olivaceomarginata]
MRPTSDSPRTLKNKEGTRIEKSSFRVDDYLPCMPLTAAIGRPDSFAPPASHLGALCCFSGSGYVSFLLTNLECSRHMRPPAVSREVATDGHECKILQCWSPAAKDFCADESAAVMGGSIAVSLVDGAIFCLRMRPRTPPCDRSPTSAAESAAAENQVALAGCCTALEPQGRSGMNRCNSLPPNSASPPAILLLAVMQIGMLLFLASPTSTLHSSRDHPDDLVLKPSKPFKPYVRTSKKPSNGSNGCCANRIISSLLASGLTQIFSRYELRSILKLDDTKICKFLENGHFYGIWCHCGAKFHENLPFSGNLDRKQGMHQLRVLWTTKGKPQKLSRIGTWINGKPSQWWWRAKRVTNTQYRIVSENLWCNRTDSQWCSIFRGLENPEE